MDVSLTRRSLFPLRAFLRHHPSFRAASPRQEEQAQLRAALRASRDEDRERLRRDAVRAREEAARAAQAAEEAALKAEHYERQLSASSYADGVDASKARARPARGRLSSRAMSSRVGTKNMANVDEDVEEALRVGVREVARASQRRGVDRRSSSRRHAHAHGGVAEGYWMDEEAMLAEALARSKEEADLAAALERSRLDDESRAAEASHARASSRNTAKGGAGRRETPASPSSSFVREVESDPWGVPPGAEAAARHLPEVMGMAFVHEVNPDEVVSAMGLLGISVPGRELEEVCQVMGTTGCDAQDAVAWLHAAEWDAAAASAALLESCTEHAEARTSAAAGSRSDARTAGGRKGERRSRDDNHHNDKVGSTRQGTWEDDSRWENVSRGDPHPDLDPRRWQDEASSSYGSAGRERRTGWTAEERWDAEFARRQEEASAAPGPYGNKGSHASADQASDSPPPPAGGARPGPWRPQPGDDLRSAARDAKSAANAREAAAAAAFQKAFHGEAAPNGGWAPQRQRYYDADRAERAAAERRAKLERLEMERLERERAERATEAREREAAAAAAAAAAAERQREEARRENERARRWEKQRREHARRDAEVERERDSDNVRHRSAASNPSGIISSVEEEEDAIRSTVLAAVQSEIGSRDLPSALRVLGCVPSNDSATAVRTAYKRAALKFHPDRTRSAALADRIRGEEVWKLLSAKMEAFTAAN